MGCHETDGIGMASREEQDSALSTIVIGTRGSKLALWQAGWVKERLEEFRPDVKCELRIVKTRGDARQRWCFQVIWHSQYATLKECLWPPIAAVALSGRE